MAPKKKSTVDIWVAVICLVLVVYICLQGAAAYNTVKIAFSSEGNKGLQAFNDFLSAFEGRVMNQTVLITWTDYSLNSVLGGLFAWFIVTVYYFTTRKKLIAGKEHGTAEWGSRKDIKDLFAETILKQEIKKALQLRFFFTRYFAKRRVFLECERNGQTMEKHYHQLLDEKEATLKAKYGTDSRQYEENIKIIELERENVTETVKNDVRRALFEAWKPLQFQERYKNTVDDLQKRHAQQSLTDEEYNTAIASAYTDYKKSLRAFYGGNDKVKALKAKYQNADALLTDTERISIHNFKLNNNILILGGSGSGKTRGFVIPNLLQAHSSYVVTDPKGEILEKVGHYLSNVQGYDIRVLNLDNKAKSDGYNPFVYIHPERAGYEERVLTLIETLIVNTDGGEKKSSSDPFWDKAERLFLQAMFFFVCDGFLLHERNMNTVLSLIGMLQIAEEEDNRDSELDRFATIFEQNHGSHHIGVQQYKEFREKASGKTAKSIVISAVARLAPFRASAIRKIFSHDTMQLDMLGERKTAIFVVVPPTDTTFNFIAGMLYTQMFQELQYCASEIHKHEGQRLPVPVRFILDEFANTCTIPNFVKILAYARSFGIGIVPILQSLEQIKNMYKDEWGVIVDNCNTLLFLGSITHMDTLEYMTKLLGKGTYDKRTTGRTRSKQGSSSLNWDVIGRELMDAAEIRKLPKENCLLVVGGRNPFYSLKYSYPSHPYYCYTSDGNPNYKFDYVPHEIPTTQNEESTHREYIPTAPAPGDNARVETEEIHMIINPQVSLNHITSNVKNLVPAPDEDMSADDGEPALTEEERQFYLSLLSYGEDVAATDNNALPPSEKAPDTPVVHVEAEIVMITNPIAVAKTCAITAKNMIPASDEDYAVDDGEPPLSGLDDILFYEDEFSLIQDLNESGELLGDTLNTLIDALPPDSRDTIIMEMEKSIA